MLAVYTVCSLTAYLSRTRAHEYVGASVPELSDLLRVHFAEVFDGDADERIMSGFGGPIGYVRARACVGAAGELGIGELLLVELLCQPYADGIDRQGGPTSLAAADVARDSSVSGSWLRLLRLRALTLRGFLLAFVVSLAAAAT